jgi:hypothetical protein
MLPILFLLFSSPLLSSRQACLISQSLFFLLLLQTEKRREQEKEDEDKNYDNDDNIRKLREWDDFKDANPTGSGNRINQG